MFVYVKNECLQLKFYATYVIFYCITSVGLTLGLESQGHILFQAVVYVGVCIKINFLRQTDYGVYCFNILQHDLET